MLIPLRHENMQGRRWPVITFGIIALNVIVFLGTHWTMDKQGPELGQVKLHLILLAAMHPEPKIPGKAQEFVTSIQTKNAASGRKRKTRTGTCSGHLGRRNAHEGGRAPGSHTDEMDSLSAHRYEELELRFASYKYAFIPAHPTALEPDHREFPARRLAAPHRQYVVSCGSRARSSRTPGGG